MCRGNVRLVSIQAAVCQASFDTASSHTAVRSADLRRIFETGIALRTVGRCKVAMARAIGGFYTNAGWQKGPRRLRKEFRERLRPASVATCIHISQAYLARISVTGNNNVCVFSNVM